MHVNQIGRACDSHFAIAGSGTHVTWRYATESSESTTTPAAMQGFNKYYPPDYDGAKHKSLNAYRGKHALGDRARKLDQGVLITR